MFLLIIPLSVLIGWLAGGRLTRLGKLRLRWIPLVLIALIVQLLIFPIFGARALLPYAQQALHILSYVLLIAWIAANLRVRPIILLAIGAVCNAVVLLANGGLMPASLHALEQAGLGDIAVRLAADGRFSNLVAQSPDTPLAFLGDVLYLPAWIPFSTAFSIGDLLIVLALGWLIVKGMRTDGTQTRVAA